MSQLDDCRIRQLYSAVAETVGKFQRHLPAILQRLNLRSKGVVVHLF